MTRKAFIAALLISPFVVAAEKTSSRKSADGMTFPEVTFPVESLGPRDKKLKGADFINSLMNRPPEEVTSRAMSTAKNREQLDKAMSRFEEYDVAARISGDNIIFRKPNHEINHNLRKIVDRLPSETWFVRNLEGTGADVVGFDLKDGVLSHMTLYYQRQSVIIEKIRNNAISLNAKRYIYKIFTFGKITYVDVLGTMPIYVNSHPDFPENIKQSMENYKLIDGMTLEQSIAMFGEPDLHFIIDGRSMVSFIQIGEFQAIEWRYNGHPAASWTMIDGTVWTAALKNGKISNVIKTP